MTFRTGLLKTVQRLRKLPSETFDVYTSSVVFRTRVWSNGRVQSGTATTTDVEILPRPKVRKILSSNDLKVGPITPANSSGGYAPDDLVPSDVAGTEYVYVVTGPDAVEREYAVAWIDTSKAFGYVLHLSPIDRRTPF